MSILSRRKSVGLFLHLGLKVKHARMWLTNTFVIFKWLIRLLQNTAGTFNILFRSETQLVHCLSYRWNSSGLTFLKVVKFILTKPKDFCWPDSFCHAWSSTTHFFPKRPLEVGIVEAWVVYHHSDNGLRPRSQKLSGQ